MSIGLALGGGGIKGIAHLGVMKCLEENNVEIDCISGCSSGSIIATLYACGYSVNEIYQLINYYINKISNKLFKNSINSIFFKRKLMGINNGNIIESIINKCCNNKKISDISEIHIPIFVPTVDLYTGKLIYFTNIYTSRKRYLDNITYINEGNIGEIVRASCSYPGIFSPKKYGEYLLSDGGIRDNVPVTPLKDNCMNNILAISFEENEKEEVNSIFDVIIQSFSILSHDMKYESMKNAKYKLNIKLDNVKLLDYTKIEYIYKEGYIQTKKFLLKNFLL